MGLCGRLLNSGFRPKKPWYPLFIGGSSPSTFALTFLLLLMRLSSSPSARSWVGSWELSIQSRSPFLYLSTFNQIF